ncbi:MAG TPA: hypothetical protein PLD59_15170 [Tepidisphaeraceae bacterium]|nr:hypothetical protein [Tepidisphaeraceae bacterium]
MKTSFTSAVAMVTGWLVAGCAPYTQLKIDLVDQSCRGLSFVEQSMAQRQRAHEEFHVLQRAQLDRAFDDDARSRSPLTPEWVIDARKAYAAGVDLLHRQSAAGMRAHETAVENLAEVNRLLQQIQMLHRIEQRLVMLGSRR